MNHQSKISSLFFCRIFCFYLKSFLFNPAYFFLLDGIIYISFSHLSWCIMLKENFSNFQYVFPPLKNAFPITFKIGRYFILSFFFLRMFYYVIPLMKVYKQVKLIKIFIKYIIFLTFKRIFFLFLN